MSMSAANSSDRVWLWGWASLLLGIALWFAPAQVVARLRGVFLDLLRPGLESVQAVDGIIATQRTAWQSAEIQQLNTQLRELKLAEAQQAERIRRLSVLLADLQEQPVSTLPGTIDVGTPLFTPSVISGRVLGSSLSQSWRTGVVFDRGWPAGVREAALVVQGDAPLIDVGEREHLSPEDPLILGRIVLGKVEVVGRWTSTYLPVTDREFRGPAQLLHGDSVGQYWGAKGLLRGNGMSCELQGISSTETVRVGDDVFTADRDGILEAPLYYGKVAKAELTEDGREWIVIVEPAARPSSLTHVQVVRAALNPQRIVTN